LKNTFLNKSRLDLSLCVVEQSQSVKRAYPKGAEIAEVGKHIKFDPDILNTFDYKGWQSLHHDLLVVSTAVEFADRRWKRPRSWSRKFNITVPVLDPTAWQRKEVIESLLSALRHLTADIWSFNFVQWRGPSPIGARQGVLAFTKTKAFTIAYSDGLDSRAVSALSGDKLGLRVRIAKSRNRLKKGDQPFDQIPFKVQGFRGLESSFRSRGFQFSAITAIAAHMSELSRVVVPESGQGALGPVLLPLHNIHPDYRNHPTFFRKMERFVRALLGYQVKYDQPRIWHTKGQTLGAFLELPGKKQEDLTDTRSCWQTRRIVNTNGERKQCGLCAACLLRRLSMHTAGIAEAPDAYVIADLKCSDVNESLAVIPQQRDRDIMIEYGSVGARHLQHLAEMADLPDGELRIHASELAAALGESREDTMKNLRTLLVNHAEEWRAFLTAQEEKSFLKSWMDGGRYDRSK